MKHRFDDGNEIIRNNFVYGWCPIVGGYFQHAYTDHSREGTGNACLHCGDDPTFSVGERLRNLERSRKSVGSVDV